jgi:putative transposase
MRNKVLSLLPESIESDCKIFWDRGAYYLVLNLKEEKEWREKDEGVALDPGVRTFLTGYSPHGTVFKMGDNHVEKVKQLHALMDALRSAQTRDGIRRRTRWRIKQKLSYLELCLYNTIQELHNQSASRLVQHYGTILLPTFGTSEMLQGRKLHACTKRRMQSLSHYRFQQKLIGLCQKYGTHLYLVDESYTTKTCGSCGRIHDVGGSHVYECECGYRIDRDIHGARNIWIKTCTEHGVMKHTPQTIVDNH